MKKFPFSLWFAALSCTTIYGAPCLPGNLQTFVNLGATGCEVETVQFTNFAILPEQATTTRIDAAQVQVTPGGTALNPLLLFTLDRTANAGETLASLFRFSASDSLIGASVGLTSPRATGDAAVVGILDVCPGGVFKGDAPFDCPATPASLAVFAIDQSSLLSQSASFAVSNSFDVFVDLTLDGGQSGSATLDSATVGFSSIPEPSTGLLLALGLSAFAILRASRGILAKIPRGNARRHLSSS